MNLTTWLDVAIGLALIFLGVSLFVTVINEYITQTLNLRGKHLCDSLLKLVDDPAVKKKLSEVPALKPFFGGGKTPSYVDPNLLARQLLGGLDGRLSASSTVQQIGAAIDQMADSKLKTQLQAIVRTTEGKVEDLVTAVSAWADRSLGMFGEFYKRRLQLISLAIGLALAILLNIDTVALTGRLYRDREAREATVALAVQVTEQTSKAAFDRCAGMSAEERELDTACTPLAGLIDAVRGRNESLGKLPLGWSGAPPESLVAWALRVLGWVLTGLAVSFGAPFWFDLLNKFVNIRHAMRKPEVKPAGGT